MDFLPALAATAVGADVEVFSAAGMGALLTLALMEIVLGIDNVVFIAILVAKLPKEQQKLGRNIGMGLALVMRLGLLFIASWIMKLTDVLITLPAFMQKENDAGLSGRDLILLGGGLFLIYKATKEIYEKLEGDEHHAEGGSGGGKAKFGPIIFQIILLDLVFSLDSVITAVGMVQNITIMIIAMFAAVGVMIASAASIGDFVHKHPSVKILALSFLNMIGVMLILEGFGSHIDKGYVYSAMAFSLLVELLNMRFRTKKDKPVELHEPTVQQAGLKES
jgi:predicted tellurium resistance membrane protein TerC